MKNTIIQPQRMACVSILLGVILMTPTASAQITESFDPATYTQMAEVHVPPLLVPTTVETLIAPAVIPDPNGLVVYEGGTDTIIQSTVYLMREASKPIISISQNTGSTLASTQDGDSTTFYTIEAFPNGREEGDTWITTIMLRYREPVFVTDVLLALREMSAEPTQVQVSVMDGAPFEVVVPWQPYVRSIAFPERRYVQMVRIQLEHTEDIQLAEIAAQTTGSEPYHKLHFLAQPGESYQVYTSPITDVSTYGRSTIRTGTPNAGATRIAALTFRDNPAYFSADLDGDGLPTASDNCNEYANANQEDINTNGIGDACEDFDGDGIVAALDNCPNRPNQDQRDADDDGIGDVCDDEESRLTEKYVWVPWAGLAVAAAVLVSLFILVSRQSAPLGRVSEQETGTSQENHAEPT